MWHKLAAHVLHCTVDEAMERVSHQEFLWWLAFDRINPLGPERIEYMLGKLCMITHNMQVAKKKDLKELREFMPNWGGVRDEADQESLVQKLTALGGKVFKWQS